MPRIGFPAASKAGRNSESRSSSSPWTLSAAARIAVAAIAFRVISALVGAFVARVFPGIATAAADSASTTFGLLPLIARELARGLGGVLRPPFTAPLVVSWLAFALAMVMMQRVGQLDTDEERAESAALLAAVFPFASAFGHANADSLFLLFVLTAFYGV